ncbi:hypothetical protein THASP1DRAFT_27312 [Thamnocephalis sphaerospora]|uniref:Uncharacterized protein n=1 Tax=Thamnocephalis sphaerospora TaxID=78915 RepID=A0A4P9XWZ6_9FUNG|nr:hypothetical protein THASP1DRAFT_27312 [Thamnocephalis sphaerospora]|eukprot:RKP10888.1 hypothetical protein THASP1DRAFT_27312 [Thamnocephalis sphaerospora]
MTGPSDAETEVTSTSTYDTDSSEPGDPGLFDTSDSESESDWEEEWEETVRELKFLVTGIVIPFVGRWFGRRFSFWIWTRYLEPWLGVAARAPRIAAPS